MATLTRARWAKKRLSKKFIKAGCKCGFGLSQNEKDGYCVVVRLRKNCPVDMNLPEKYDNVKVHSVTIGEIKALDS